MIELESLEAFDKFVRSNASLNGVAVQGLDLSERVGEIAAVDVEGGFFLGCLFTPETLARLNAGGACVFPRFPNMPFRAFRSTLYSADELYDGYVPGDHATYDGTVDGQTYRWHEQVKVSQDVVATLAERVHDHAIDDALHALLDEVGTTEVVAIMGGHAMGRDAKDYRQVARLSRSLTRAGLYVATGGGPGAMEAANFGAWMADHPDEALDEALAVLATAPSYKTTGEWLDTGFAVRKRWPRPNELPSSLGVPTWHYGHEPPNVFATEIAKYFANSIREEGLLAIALAGVVFTPGSAGTIQEVFQDAAQNHYESFGFASPMVFLDRAYWTETKPIYPVLQHLAQGCAYADSLAAFDDVNEVCQFILDHKRSDPKPQR